MSKADDDRRKEQQKNTGDDKHGNKIDQNQSKRHIDPKEGGK